eukprot:10045242-Lingulodinium_polyedra.AAC.1
MVPSPFGPGVVSAEGRYLGGWLVSPSWGPLQRGVVPMWTSPSLEIVATGTWKKPATTVSSRTMLLLQHPSSFIVRAEHWNTYCVSLIPFPSQITPPS